MLLVLIVLQSYIPGTIQDQTRFDITYITGTLKSGEQVNHFNFIQIFPFFTKYGHSSQFSPLSTYV